MRGLVVKEIHSQLPNLNLGGVSLYKYIPGIPAVMKSTSVYSPCPPTKAIALSKTTMRTRTLRPTSIWTKYLPACDPMQNYCSGEQLVSENVHQLPRTESDDDGHGNTHLLKLN